MRRPLFKISPTKHCWEPRLLIDLILNALEWTIEKRGLREGRIAKVKSQQGQEMGF